MTYGNSRNRHKLLYWLQRNITWSIIIKTLEYKRKKSTNVNLTKWNFPLIFAKKFFNFFSNITWRALQPMSFFSLSLGFSMLWQNNYKKFPFSNISTKYCKSQIFWPQPTTLTFEQKYIPTHLAKPSKQSQRSAHITHHPVIKTNTTYIQFRLRCIIILQLPKLAININKQYE